MFVSVALTLAVLSVFRWIELKVPTQAYYNFDVKYANDGNLTEEQMRTLIQSHMFSIANFSYRLDAEGRVLRHSMTLRTTDRGAASRLAHTLKENWAVIEFRLSPTGD
jgi:putative Mg2+ transporter-C (MgtC) family protein